MLHTGIKSATLIVTSISLPVKISSNKWKMSALKAQKEVCDHPCKTKWPAIRSYTNVQMQISSHSNLVWRIELLNQRKKKARALHLANSIPHNNSLSQAIRIRVRAKKSIIAWVTSIWLAWTAMLKTKRLISHHQSKRRTWGPSPAESNRSCRVSKVKADLVLKTRTTICRCTTRLTNRIKFSSLLQALLTSIASKCLLTWSPWPRLHTISPSTASQSITSLSLIKLPMVQRSEEIITTSLSPQARTLSRTPTSLTAINLVFKAIARRQVIPNNSKTNRTHKPMMSWKRDCLMSIRSSSTIRKVVQVGEDKLVFHTQLMMSKHENMVAIWLFNRKIVQANDKL